MASPSPWRSVSPSFLNPHATIRSSKNPPGLIRRRKNRTTICGQDISNQEHQLFDDKLVAINRREVMLQIAYSAFIVPVAASPAFAIAENDNFRVYTDELDKFEISIPQDWQVGKGEPNGFKSITAFYPEEASTSNVSVVITGLGPDFTRMESFGKVEAFAETLVSGLDRSWQRPPGVTAKLVDCKATKGFYYIEYTLQNPGETRTHLYSAIGMASNGWYNRLYTVTGRFMEHESDKFISKIQKAVDSFRFI